MLLLISGNLSLHLLARHVLLHVQSDDLLLHESKVRHHFEISTTGTIQVFLFLIQTERNEWLDQSCLNCGIRPIVVDL